MNASNELKKSVEKILFRVEKEGDKALAAYSRQFDKTALKPSEFFIGRAKMAEGYRRCNSDIRGALQTAKSRIESFHRCELDNISNGWSINLDGIRAGQRATAIPKAALYVPGGRFCYPSTVLMTAIPAKVAGVEELIVATPKKNLRDEVLAAAHLAGVDRILCLGGPWAIAALAYGTKTVPRVDKIVGPGNAYVTEAKRQVFGKVGIDGLAGPSEIAVWADSKADLKKVVMNLLAQAEHDPDSRCYLLTRERKVSELVRKEIPEASLKQIEFLVMSTEAAIINKIDAIAPEHLYLALSNAKSVWKRVKNAGAIFVGEDAVVPLGDYSAGPSHVLPTGGSARFASGLSVKDFLKWSSVIERTPGQGKKAVAAARILAGIEGLSFHERTLALCQ